ncbi:MAG TPA: FkbM family methyltransferase [Acidiphilium sp.]
MAELVAIVPLDSLIEQLGLNQVDFIKADIEGYEMEMIRGAYETIKKFRPVILLEMDDTFLRKAGSSLKNLWCIMLEFELIPYDIDGKELPKEVPLTTDGDILWVPREKLEHFKTSASSSL